jgi:hypothetical protein
MIFVMIATALLSGTLTALGLWPVLGGFALLAAPFGASATAFAVAVAAATWWPAKADPEQVQLDAIADQLVAELRTLSQPAPARTVPAVRKAG